MGNDSAGVRALIESNPRPPGGALGTPPEDPAKGAPGGLVVNHRNYYRQFREFESPRGGFLFLGARN